MGNSGSHLRSTLKAYSLPPHVAEEETLKLSCRGTRCGSDYCLLWTGNWRVASSNPDR